MSSLLDPLSGSRSRRRSRLGFGLIAFAAALVLVLTAVIQAGTSTSRSARLPWAIASLAVTTVLLTVFVMEIIRRVRTERASTRVDQALLPLGRHPGSEPDDRPLAVQLDELLACVVLAMGARTTVSLLDPHVSPPSRVTGGSRAAAGCDGATATEISNTSDITGSHLTVELVREGVRLGSLEVRAAPDEELRRADQLVLQLMAPRVAAQIERARLGDAERRSRLEAEHARRQVNVLARASVPLAPGLENPEETISELADIVVPEFADLFAVDIKRDGSRLERIVVAYDDAGMASAFAALSGDHPHWSDTLHRVMSDGESELVFSREADDDPPHDDHGALLHALGMQSWVVAPIRVRNASLGTMTLATTRNRRGYRPSDQVTIDDLVARSAIAFERGLLYQEARHAASEASRRANQLARMVEATTVLTHTLAPTALLQALVEQAAYVLEAPYAHAELAGEGGSVAEYGTRAQNPVRISGPLVDRMGEGVGRLTVERPEAAPFAADDGVVVTMLAESASVANRNAQLYQEARNREQRLQAVIEASPLAILEIDRAGTVLVANPAARMLFPVSDPGAIGLVQPPPEVVDRLAELLTETLRGKRCNVELITTDGSGEQRDLWVSTAPVSGEGLDAMLMLAVITDMTGRKRLEEQLAKAQRFEAIATLAGGVAHDFNNLLTVILGYSEILLHGLPEAAPEREPVEAIQEAGNHAAVITNQLLTLSRHQVLQPETIDAVARCAALVPMLRRLAGSAVTIETELVGSARIKVDPGQLEQVLFNLVFNSRDAMPRGGNLRIEAGQRLDPHGHDLVFVRVTDDGEGMDAETLARCQEPFFTTKGRSRGIGLGLATVASILERSGGTLEMTSEPGRGTSSTVSFPGLGAAEPSVDPGSEPARGRVLLVDDDDQVRRFTARVLTKSGYRVTEVPDGESAICQLEVDDGFDLVVADVTLPAMSGAAVVRTVRDRWAAMACLLITGYADAHLSDTDVGDTMLVPKPFTPEDLVRAVEGAMHAAEADGRSCSRA